MDILKQGKNKSSLYLITVFLTYLTVILGFLLYNQLPAFAADTTPPTFVKAEASSKQMVYLTFSEPIKQNVGSISITGNGNPDLTITSVTYASDARILRLTVSTQVYGNKYPTPSYYTVTVTDIQDLAGNTISPNPATQNFDAFTPHGKYSPYPVTSGNSNRQCGQCHLTHSATGYDLLNRTTIKKVCFVCHGNAGPSVYMVEKEFTSWVAGGSYSTSMHKSLDAEDGGNNKMTCVDCHDPHGIRRSGADIYPKLLRSKNVYGAVYNSGTNWFCLACHGFGDVNPQYGNRFGTYWNNTRGDHNWGMTAQDGSKPIPHFATEFTAMIPASGTNVTCVKCHERHGSTWSWLGDHSRADGEEDQCYKCHGKDANYGMTGGYNVYNLITTSVSKHRVADTVYGKVECSSCHGPHTVGNAKYVGGKVYSAISDPDNTKIPYTTTSGRLSQFCIRCHDSSPPSTASNSATTVVPYNISFIDPGFSTNGGKWNKDAPYSYINSGHYNNTQLRGQTDTYGNYKNECSLCHEWHGTPYRWLVRLDEDKNGADGICLQCHKSGNGYTVPLGGVISLDVKTPLGYTFAHPTIQSGYAGRHKNTENYYRDAQADTTKRHAQCYDCHDPHTVKNSWANVNDEIYKLGNVSGVKFSQTAWNSWGTATATAVYLDPTTNNLQAYLCYKCHSKFAYTPDANGDAPFNTPSSNPSAPSSYDPGWFKQTDVAKEFNPANKARHVVEGTSQMPTFTDNSVTYYYGKFVNGWTATSKMKCTDCHAPASGARGPHGSSTRFILRANWNPTQSATMTSSDLCFLCHDYGFYYGGTDNGTASRRSQFSGGSQGYNGHSTKHKAGKQKNCSNCHGGLPHGWKYTDSNGGGQALFSSTDARPYKDGSYLGDIPTNATRTPEQWSSQHSGTSCGNTGSCT